MKRIILILMISLLPILACGDSGDDWTTNEDTNDTGYELPTPERN